MVKEAVVLIPSYEPSHFLIETVEAITKEDFPVLLINDGSSPTYDPLFAKVASLPRVIYRSYPVNHGKGYAMKYGFALIPELYPSARFVITVDGDGQHALTDILRIYDALIKKDELVFGVRSFPKGTPWKSRLGNQLSKINRSLLTKQYIADDQCGLRGFPVRYLPSLINTKGSRYEYEMNELIRCQMMQCPVYSLPIQTIYTDEKNSASHFRPVRDTLKIQGIILFHSIGALLTNALLMFLLITFLERDSFPLWLDTFLAYTSCFFLYFLFLSIFYPSQRFYRRLSKELLFSAIRMAACSQFLFLFIRLLHGPIIPMVILSVLLSAYLNVLLSWAFRKIYRAY